MKKQTTEERIANLEKKQADQQAVIITMAHEIMRGTRANTLNLARLLDIVRPLVSDVEMLKRGAHLAQATGDERSSEAREIAGNLVLMMDILKSSFNSTNLKELVIRANMSAELITASKDESVINILEEARRNNKFWRLVKEAKRMRPNIPADRWPRESARLRATGLLR